MIQRKSLLNPYAAPYIPLSKIFSGISFEGENKASEIISSDSGNTQHIGDTAGYQVPGTVSVEYSIQTAEKLQVSDASSSKTANQISVSENDTSQDETIVNEKQSGMDDPELIMETLSAMFPDISIESLAELFRANGGDLSETIDMLEQLEFEGGGSEETPETLGDWQQFRSER